MVTIGNFDGVHRGHRHVIARARALASEVDARRVVAVTFDPHPIAVLRPDHAPNTLTGIDERVRLLARGRRRRRARRALQPRDRRLVARSTSSRRSSSAPCTPPPWWSARTSASAAAPPATSRRCKELGQRHDFVAEGVELDGGPQVWSSTYIRTCLAAGDVEGAAEALGRPVVVRGTVQRGDQRGREIGYPTANVPPGETAAPADGVYAGWVYVDGEPERLPAAISVGTNPTFAGERDRRVEAYVLDRDDLELYDREIAVELVAKVRGMTRFDSLEELLAAMAGDVADTRRVLGLS